MQALQRLLQVTEAVAATPGGATPTEVAATVGLSLSTVSRLLHDLDAADVVDRQQSSGRYRLGLRLVRIVQAVSQNPQTQGASRGVMTPLRDLAEETVSLHVRVGMQRLCIDVVPSPHAVARVIPIGVPLPLLGSATGEVLMSAVLPDELDEIIAAGGLSSTDADALRERLDHVRKDGWSLIADTWALGVTGISVAVRDLGGTTAALSVSGPSARFSRTRAQAMLPLLQKATRDLADAAMLESGSLAGWLR